MQLSDTSQSTAHIYIYAYTCKHTSIHPPKNLPRHRSILFSCTPSPYLPPPTLARSIPLSHPHPCSSRPLCLPFITLTPSHVVPTSLSWQGAWVRACTTCRPHKASLMMTLRKINCLVMMFPPFFQLSLFLSLYTHTPTHTNTYTHAHYHTCRTHTHTKILKFPRYDEVFASTDSSDSSNICKASNFNFFFPLTLWSPFRTPWSLCLHAESGCVGGEYR